MKRILFFGLLYLFSLLPVCQDYIIDMQPMLNNEYSQVYSAYREFLLGQRVCKSGEDLYSQYYTSGADNSEFTFVDINGDGVPELHFRSKFQAYTIYSFHNGDVFLVATFQQNAELMNNHAVFSDYWASNTISSATRKYTEFGEDLQPRLSIYFDYDSEVGIYRIAYNSQEVPTNVTEMEFTAITTPILSYCMDDKNYDMILWTNYGEWLRNK